MNLYDNARMLKVINDNYGNYKLLPENVRNTVIAASMDPVKEDIFWECLGRMTEWEKTRYEKIGHVLCELMPGMDEQTYQLVTLRGFSRHDEKNELINRTISAYTMFQDIARLTQRFISYVHPEGFDQPSRPRSSEREAATELYKTWFDKKIMSHRLVTVKKTFNKVLDIATTKPLVLVCDGTPSQPDGPCGCGANTCAKVNQLDPPGRIYLGAKFFTSLHVSLCSACSQAASPPVQQGTTFADMKEHANFGVLDAVLHSVLSLLHEVTHIPVQEYGVPPTDDVLPEPYEAEDCMEKAEMRPNDAVANAQNYAWFAAGIYVRNRVNPMMGVKLESPRVALSTG
jgi:hypothetical protein